MFKGEIFMLLKNPSVFKMIPHVHTHLQRTWCCYQDCRYIVGCDATRCPRGLASRLEQSWRTSLASSDVAGSDTSGEAMVLLGDPSSSRPDSSCWDRIQLARSAQGPRRMEFEGSLRSAREVEKEFYFHFEKNSTTLHSLRHRGFCLTFTIVK